MQYFPLNKHSLLDDFSIDGGWIELKEDSNQTTPQDEYKFGTLKYKNGVGKLSLFQGWDLKIKALTAHMPLYRKSNILGYIANDVSKFVYIPQISTTPGLSMLHLPSVVYDDWHMNRFSIIDFFPNNMSKKIFNKVLLDFTLLDDWIKPYFRLETSYSDLQTKVKSVDSGALACFTYKDQLFKVELIGYINQEHNQNDKYVNYKNDSWILIEGENDISSDQSIFFATELRKMFSVVLGRPLNTTQLSRKGFDKDTHKSLTEDIYFLEMRFQHNSDKLFIYEMFREERDIQLDNLIPNWFNKEENFDLLVQDYLLTISYNETIQNKLINLTEGIEAYYRDEKMSLYKKIKNMLNSLPTYVIDKLKEHVGNIDEWAQAIKQTRVYIAHGEKKAKVIDDIIELSQAVNALQYLTQYFILQELGMKIDYEQMVSMVLDNCFNTERL